MERKIEKTLVASHAMLATYSAFQISTIRGLLGGLFASWWVYWVLALPMAIVLGMFLGVWRGRSVAPLLLLSTLYWLWVVISYIGMLAQRGEVIGGGLLSVVAAVVIVATWGFLGYQHRRIKVS